MPRLILWCCDFCGRESRSESTGWLVLKEFRTDRPKFYSFCNWDCLTHYLDGRGNNKRFDANKVLERSNTR